MPRPRARPLLNAALLVLLALAALALPCAPALAQKPGAQPAPLAGVVTRIVDGDTLHVTPDGGAPVTVRLRDIDAPEICQPHGPEARAALQDYALGQAVTMRVFGRDTHGRTIARVATTERDLSVRMVEEGHAWSVRTRFDRGPLVREERMAKALGRGLHASAGHVFPWEFRRRHGPCAGPAAASSPAASPGAPAPGTGPQAGALRALPSAPAAPAAAVAGAYRCDGRRYCTQMRSCAEATWFLRHCPDTRMDGDHDGVPCETQWCVAGGR
jgi:endonuclease YncB( thermonuclease family)